MGGEGSMSAANASLKYNRSQLRKNKRNNVQSLYEPKYSKEKLEFIKVSPEELRIVKEDIRKKLKHQRKRTFIITILIALVILSGIVWFIFKL